MSAPSSRNCKCFMIFSCAVNVVLAIVFGVLVGLNWDKLLDNYFRFSNSETPQSVIGNATVSGKAITIRDSVCFSCDYLGSGVSVNETLYEEIVTTDCKHKLCCIKDKVIHDFVIATQNENNENENSSSIRDSFAWWRNRANSAHFYLDREIPVSKENKLRWKADDTYGTAFAQDIVLVNGTHMRIKQDGIYFIYTSTTFDHSRQDTVETIYQSLIKYHPYLPKTGDVDLVFSKFGGSRESDRHHTNFLAGVFKLEPGFLIASSLSQRGHVFLDASSPIKNYIGLYKL
uniref:Fas ligand-like protein n=1 Tax=Ostrea edulis TaxID=37623 RepID=V9HX39_OSTED|nr:Fas ligand-like protein [Ostrea edulis]